MVRTKRNYKEGDWFAVPIEGKFVVGRIARIGARGSILLGYFFNPLLSNLPDEAHLSKLHPVDAFEIAFFGGGGLQDGTWPNLGAVDSWQREGWPLPKFGRLSADYATMGQIIQYDEKYLGVTLGSWTVPKAEVIKYPVDAVSGHISMEITLMQYFALSESALQSNPPHFVLSGRLYWYIGLPDEDRKKLDPTEQLGQDPDIK